MMSRALRPLNERYARVFDEGYEAGKAEGRRLERLRVHRLRKKTGVCVSCGRFDQLDKAKVAEILHRTKPAKRKGKP
jgi:tRNA G37 N-methylase TrmD